MGAGLKRESGRITTTRKEPWIPERIAALVHRDVLNANGLLASAHYRRPHGVHRRFNSSHMKLDDERSSVVLSEWNEFIWPGPDLQRVPVADDSSVAYGMLSPKLFMQIRDRLVALIQSHEARPVRRI